MIQKSRHIEDYKNLTQSLPSIKYVNPERIFLPITNQRCNKGEVFIEVGDHVQIGQVIGVRDGGFFKQNIHSTVSGTYVGNEKRTHRSGRIIECIVIENDFNDEYCDTVIDRSEEDIAAMTKEDVIEAVRENSVVGLGGSGFPTYIKLESKDEIDTIILNGVECEPYLTSDYRLMMEKPKRVFEGLNLLMRTYGAKRGIIAVKEDKKGLIELLNMYNKRYADSKIEIMGVGNYYPQGYEKEVIKNIMGLNIPPGVLPSKHGIMVFNVTTAAAVYLAIKYNMPVTKRYFTVTGDAVKYPSNFRVRIGAELKNMIDQVGGYTTEDRVIILGGPMMGASLTNDNIIVSKTSTSVIVLKDEQVAEEACVRCSSCVYSCPMELQPVLLMNASKARNKDALKKMNVLNCIECGLCTYTCTSKIHVTEWMRRGKRLAKL